MITLNLWHKMTWWLGMTGGEKIWDQQDRGWTFHVGKPGENNWASCDDEDVEDFVFTDRFSMFGFTVQVDEELVKRAIAQDLYWQHRNTPQEKDFPPPPVGWAAK